MRAGMMRDRVTVREEVRTSDGQGGVTQEWVNVVTNEPCQLVIKPGREVDEGDKRTNTGRAILKLRYHEITATIEPKHSAIIDGVEYQILDVSNPDRRKRQLELILEKGSIL